MGDLWQFSSISCMEEFSFNKVLEKFYNYGIVGLVRENIQNSLDGKLQDNDGPVIVTIKTGTIKKDDIPGLEEVKSRIKCLKGKNSYTKETIKHMQNKMNDELVNYISFEDSNTKGLSGAKHGQTNNPKDTWSIYAYNKGVHGEEDDESVEKSKGGSHGIGKIASNAASDLYMMYFANCDENGDQHLGGTVQLIEHEFESNYYRATGYFTKVEQDANNSSKTKFMPHENNYGEVFRKDTRGLKIIIPFLREQFNDELQIIRSVCDSFFVAILDGKLEVTVNDKNINSQNISSFINSKIYYEQEIENIKNVFTKLYFNTYTTKEPRIIKISDLWDTYEFDLYFDYDLKIPTGRMAIIRTIGMKIEDKKIKNNVRKPFNAVLIPKSLKEDEFLKSLENESHSELSFDHIKDPSLQKNAKKFIRNISLEISKIIEDEIRKSNPTDGIMDTRDVLYEVTATFKKALSEATATVNIKKKNSKDPKSGSVSSVSLIKIGGKEKHTKVKTKRKDIKPGDNGTKTKKVRTTIDSDGENRIVYKAPTNVVQRVVTSNKEYVKFNFSQMKELKNVDTCDISLAVIDGMGEEYKNEFNMKDSYQKATDIQTKDSLTIEDNLIRDVKIENGIAQIQLDLKPEYNKSLKFVYYVEV